MTSIYHVIVDPVVGLTRSLEASAAHIFHLKAPHQSLPISRPGRRVQAIPVARAIDRAAPWTELIKVLDRAAVDNTLLAELSERGSQALHEYDLSPEEQAALLSGDIRWIEARVGPLDDRQRTALWCRLQREAW